MILKASIETLSLPKRDRRFAREVLKRSRRVDDDAMIAVGIDYYLTKHGEGVLSGQSDQTFMASD